MEIFYDLLFFKIKYWKDSLFIIFTDRSLFCSIFLDNKKYLFFNIYLLIKILCYNCKLFNKSLPWSNDSLLLELKRKINSHQQSPWIVFRKVSINSYIYNNSPIKINHLFGLQLMNVINEIILPTPYDRHLLSESSYSIRFFFIIQMIQLRL